MKWTEQLLEQESQVSLHLQNRNGYVNHNKLLSSARSLTPATKRKQIRICNDKRYLALFDDQHHKFGVFKLLSWSENLPTLWGLWKGKNST